MSLCEPANPIEKRKAADELPEVLQRSKRLCIDGEQSPIRQETQPNAKVPFESSSAGQPNSGSSRENRDYIEALGLSRPTAGDSFD